MGKTFAGQKRKKAYNISRALKVRKMSNVYVSYPITPMIQLPTFGVLSIWNKLCKALDYRLIRNLVRSKLNTQLSAMTIIMSTYP